MLRFWMGTSLMMLQAVRLGAADIVVPAGGDFQAALDTAQPGDVIFLEAGATFTGPFTLPRKSGEGWILVRTSAPDRELPPAGRRIDPSYSAFLPKLVAPYEAVITAAPGAHHYRFLGLEIAPSPGRFLFNLVLLGDGTESSEALLPHHIVFDRCLLRGDPKEGSRRGIALNGRHLTVVGSYLSDFKELWSDSQALAGWNGPGPFRILNNYLEGAGENVLFGGGDPSIAGLVPSDIEIRGNHFYKPLSWRIGDPTYAGTPWVVKNLFELKNARRVLIEGNLFEHNWLHGQNGFAILFTVRNQDGGAPWSVVEEVTFANNVVRHAASGINILGFDSQFPSGQTRAIAIRNNLFEDINGPKWGGDGRLFQLLQGTAEVTIEHNTAFQTGEVLLASGAAHTGFVFRDNLVPHNIYGVAGDGTFGDPLLTLRTYFPDALLANNVLAGGNPLNYPLGNFFPATLDEVGFVSWPGGDYRLSGASPYRRAGTDGRDIGVAVDRLGAFVETVVWTDIVNAAVAGGTLYKTAGCAGCPDSGAASVQAISAGDGYLEFRAEETTTNRVAGLSHGNTDTTRQDIDFGLQLWSDGGVDVRENGKHRADGRYRTGDIFRIAVESGVIRYYQNGELFYESAGAPIYPLWVDTVIGEQGGTVADVVLVFTSGYSVAPVSWTDQVNVTAGSDILRKTAGCAGCPDSGAASVQAISAGDGYLEFRAEETTTNRVAGLSHGNTDTTREDIDFGLQLWSDGGVDVRENGKYRADGRYRTGDIFRIGVESGVVRYYQNGELFYESAGAPRYPLLVDTVIGEQGGTVAGAWIGRIR